MINNLSELEEKINWRFQKLFLAVLDKVEGILFYAFGDRTTLAKSLISLDK